MLHSFVVWPEANVAAAQGYMNKGQQKEAAQLLDLALAECNKGYGNIRFVGLPEALLRARRLRDARLLAETRNLELTIYPLILARYSELHRPH